MLDYKFLMSIDQGGKLWFSAEWSDKYSLETKIMDC